MGVACRKTFSSISSAAPALDPEHGVAVFGFHQEAELHLQLLRAPREVENFLGLRWQVLQFRSQAGERLLQSQELVAVFFHELAPVLECETALARRQQGKEEHRPLTHALQRAG